MDHSTTPSPTIRTILGRRSIRTYQKKPLSAEHRDIIIKGAMRAPTSGNMMLYSIIEVENQAMKDKLVKTCDNQPMIAKAPFVLLFVADYQRWYDFYRYSEVESFCNHEGLEFRTPQESDLFLACCDALIAAQNAVITAEALGIGSCYVGDIMENFEVHQELFHLPPWVFPITLLCFGYPKAAAEEGTLLERFPRQSILFKNHYRRLTSAELANSFDHLHTPSTRKGKFLGNAQNLGQHFYLRKTGADFSQEMGRSVKMALNRWIEGIPDPPR